MARKYRIGNPKSHTTSPSYAKLETAARKAWELSRDLGEPMWVWHRDAPERAVQVDGSRPFEFNVEMHKSVDPA